MNQDIVWHNQNITKKQRSDIKQQKPCLIWFTGLSGSGKSTIANGVEQRLHQLSKHTYLLDGDNVRHGLNKDLGFDENSRIENIRRIGEVSNLFIDAGIIVLSAFISPFLDDRSKVRQLVQLNEFIEVFVDADLKTCEDRDPKKLYQKARAGEIKNFTGISSPYEKPINPEVHLKNNTTKVDENVEIIISYLLNNGYIDVK